MRISGYIGQELILNLTYGFLMNQKQPRQKVVIMGNGHAIATQQSVSRMVATYLCHTVTGFLRV